MSVPLSVISLYAQQLGRRQNYQILLLDATKVKRTLGRTGDYVFGKWWAFEY